MSLEEDVVMSNEEDDSMLYSDMTMVCRGCLNSSREMKNMFKYGYDKDFFKITDIILDKKEDMSQMICTECEEAIRNWRNFRKQCQQSEQLLNNIKERQLIDEKNSKVETIPKNTVTYHLKGKTLYIKILAPNVVSPIVYTCIRNCKERFRKKCDLRYHMKKKHNSVLNVDTQYFCVYENCNYGFDSPAGKFFVARKNLNQHINKVHKSKIVCDTCMLSFLNNLDYDRHLSSCNLVHRCKMCDKAYRTKNRLLVHLLRSHPQTHKEYKEKKAETPGKSNEGEARTCDSPTRSSATQTSMNQIKKDVTLPSWLAVKTDERKKDEISTQTTLDELFSNKSQNEFSFESVSDIQTQTVSLEFGLTSNKETVTSETQSDMSIKETQTCPCSCEKSKYPVQMDIMPSPFCTSTETQTFGLDADLMSFTSAETQTCFDEREKEF